MRTSSGISPLLSSLLFGHQALSVLTCTLILALYSLYIMGFLWPLIVCCNFGH